MVKDRVLRVYTPRQILQWYVKWEQLRGQVLTPQRAHVAALLKIQVLIHQDEPKCHRYLDHPLGPVSRNTSIWIAWNVSLEILMFCDLGN